MPASMYRCRTDPAPTAAPRTRFGYGGKAGVVTGQKGSTVSRARPKQAQVDVVPAEVCRLGQVVIDHGPGDSDSRYPDTLTVALANGRKCPFQFA